MNRQVVTKDGVPVEYEPDKKGFLLLEFEVTPTQYIVTTSAECNGEMLKIAMKQISKLIEEQIERVKGQHEN